jgi:hypothetical protein
MQVMDCSTSVEVERSTLVKSRVAFHVTVTEPLPMQSIGAYFLYEFDKGLGSMFSHDDDMSRIPCGGYKTVTVRVIVSHSDDNMSRTRFLLILLNNRQGHVLISYITYFTLLIILLNRLVAQLIRIAQPLVQAFSKRVVAVTYTYIILILLNRLPPRYPAHPHRTAPRTGLQQASRRSRTTPSVSSRRTFPVNIYNNISC